MYIINLCLVLLLIFNPLIGYAGITAKAVILKGAITLKSPVITFDLTNVNNYNDISVSIPKSGYLQTNVFARAVFLTDASLLSLTTYNDTATAFPNYGDVGLRINGVDVTYFRNTSPGFKTFNYTMASGVKTVEIMTGMQLNNTISTIQGSWPTAISFVGATNTTPVVVSNTKRIVIYGDSLSSGFYGSSPTNSPLSAWPLLLRNAYGAVNGSVVLVARGNRALSYDCTDASSCSNIATELTNLLSGYTDKYIYIQISTNDYGHSTQTASTFGVNYGRLLDAIHLNNPAILIYAQTATLRTIESANTVGNTLSDYRIAVTNACTARNTYCTVVDGPSIFTIADLQDTVHLKETKQSNYSNYVKNIFAIP